MAFWPWSLYSVGEEHLAREWNDLWHPSVFVSEGERLKASFFKKKKKMPISFKKVLLLKPHTYYHGLWENEKKLETYYNLHHLYFPPLWLACQFQHPLAHSLAITVISSPLTTALLWSLSWTLLPTPIGETPMATIIAPSVWPRSVARVNLLASYLDTHPPTTRASCPLVLCLPSTDFP